MRNNTKRALSLLLTLTLVLSLAFAAAPSASAASQNDGVRHVVCTSLSAQAQAYYTGNYTWDKLSSMQGGTTSCLSASTRDSQLYDTLQNLMKSTMTASVTYNSLTNYWLTTDTQPGYTYTTLFYSDADSNSYNREHVWPNSHGSFNQTLGGSDLHHLRPADDRVNSTRGNDVWGDVKSQYANPSTCTYNGKTVLWYISSGDGLVEPNDNIKGDIARILLYVYVRWEEPNLFENQSPALSGSDGKKVIESLQTLLEWCQEDPVDQWEMARNDQVQNIQHNRNVFIDYPELAWLVFGQEIPQDMQTPSGEAAGGSTLDYTVTPASANSALGTAALTSYNQITATPAAGYYASGFSVSPTGAATISQNGNVFSIKSVTEDCTVTVQFAAKTPATVSYVVPEGVSVPGGNTSSSYLGDSVVLPTVSGTPADTSRSYSFVGWVTAPVDETTALSSLTVSASSQPYVLTNAQTTFYALYSYRVAGVGDPDTFELVTANRADWTGQYVIASSGAGYVHLSKSDLLGTNAGSNNAAVPLVNTGITKSGTVLTNVNPDYVVDISRVNGNYVMRLLGVSPDTYLSYSGTANSLTTNTSSSGTDAQWALSYSGGAMTVQNVGTTTRSLRFNNTSQMFRCYTTGQQAVEFYAATSSSTAYYLTLNDTGPAPVPPAITTTALPGGTVGTAYSETLAATGDAPITWAVTAGSLPAGLNLSAEGVLSGTPSAAGTSTFTVSATNGAGSAAREFSIAVDAVPPTVTSVAVSPATASVQQGGTQQFTATVTGTNDPAQTVTWSVAGGGAGTTISSAGLLTVAAGETASTLIVRATSTADPSKLGESTATVTAAPPTVTSVTVQPAAVSVQQGGTQQFAATVAGTNDPADTVTWSVTGGAAGTTISAEGLLTVGANETAPTLTVRATATADLSKFGESAVTVTATPPAPTFSIALDIGGTYSFPAATVGYGAQSPLSVTVTNTGNRETGALTAALSGTNAGSFTLSASSVSSIAVDGSTSFDVVPNTGLAAGTYTATVTVSGGSGIAPQTFNVSFAVNPVPTYTLTVTAGTGGAVSGTAAGDYAAGTAVSVTARANSGYTFTGWTVSGAAIEGGSTANPAAFTMPAGAVSLAANFSPTAGGASYTVTFDGSGGGVSPAPMQTGTDGRLSSLPTPIVSGIYTFDGWFTAKSGGTQITTATVFSADTTVYAHWALTVTGIPVYPPLTPSDVQPSAPPVTPPTYTNPYSDVLTSDWFYGDVQYVTEHNLMSGVGGGLFSPNTPMTRGMLVTVLYRMHGSPSIGELNNPFTDVASGQYYTDAVIWAAANNLVLGYGDGRFGPNDLITRQDMAALFARYVAFKGVELPSGTPIVFSDAARIGDYAKAAVDELTAAGILNGRPGNLFDPTGTATRAEAAAVLHRFLDVIQ